MQSSVEIGGVRPEEIKTISSFLRSLKRPEEAVWDTEGRVIEMHEVGERENEKWLSLVRDRVRCGRGCVIGHVRHLSIAVVCRLVLVCFSNRDITGLWVDSEWGEGGKLNISAGRKVFLEDF